MNTWKFRAFSLIEMMIVVAIIGILATLAYPRLERYLAQSRQSEARVNLSAIHAALKVYFAQNNQYTTNISDLGVELPDEAQRIYAYTITTEGNTFTITATGNLDDDDTEDVWTMNQEKVLTNTTNDVTN